MAFNQKQTQKVSQIQLFINIPLAYIIGGVINIELINARYKWI